MKIVKPISFLWDKGNIDKNLVKHNVNNEEIEQTFWDTDKKILIDDKHSSLEQRHILLGKTFEGRILFIIFTIRTDKIRVISARDLNKRELKLYN